MKAVTLRHDYLDTELTLPATLVEKWYYDHDEYLKKARAVRGPVDEPCDPYEWDDEYNEDIDL